MMAVPVGRFALSGSALPAATELKPPGPQQGQERTRKTIVFEESDKGP